MPTTLTTQLTINAVDSMQTYKAMEDGGDIRQNQLYLIGGSPRGKAVVFGDSLFDNPDTGTVYNFAEYLRTLDIFEEVTDYAKGGTGFGNTKASVAGYNLFELVQSASVMEKVAEASTIYICLGGNDIMTQLSPDHITETNLKGKITSSLAAIYNANPKALIYYVKELSFASINHVWETSLTYTVSQKLQACEMLMSIIEAIAECDNNLKVLSSLPSNFFTETPDYIHPTTNSAINVFDHIIFGHYKDKKIREILIHAEGTGLPESDFTRVDGYINNNLICTEDGETFFYYQFSDNIGVALIPFALKTIGTNAWYAATVLMMNSLYDQPVLTYNEIIFDPGYHDFKSYMLTAQPI